VALQRHWTFPVARRLFVKYGVRVSRVKHQTVSGASKKNQFYLSFLTQVFRPRWCETCRVIQQQF